MSLLANSEISAPLNNRSVEACTVIEVATVEPAKNLLPEVPFHLAVDALINPSAPATEGLPTTTIEACSDVHGRLVVDVWFHPGVAAIHLAFNDHRPLILSPDSMWMFVAQGFAHHVNAHAEEIRSKLVKHPGNLLIHMRRDDFVKGSPNNPWLDVVDEFATQIRAHVGDETLDMLLPAFSTTGAAEKVAGQVVLLDAMQSYFEYEVQTLCGIPRITLEGTSDDWQRLAERTEELSRFGLKWWTEPLRPILAEFVAASRGTANPQFWRSIYKRHGGSGGPYVNGWITAFFPYLTDWQTRDVTDRNPWLAGGGEKLHSLLYPAENKSDGCRDGVTMDRLPSGLAKAPFRWEYLGDRFEMEFLAGFVGVRQEAKTLALRPEIGWAVNEPARREAILSASVAE